MGGGTGERIGIFGGTFDPPHVGHVVAAVNAGHELALDRILMIPASIPWQKADSRAISPEADRLAMLHAAVDGVAALEVSTIELERGGESYTADTLEALTTLGVPGTSTELFLIVGSDVAPLLDTWKRPDVLRGLAHIVVYDRPGSVGAGVPDGWRCTRVSVPQIDVSSTDVRERVRAGRPIDGLVTGAVARHIQDRGLYRATVVDGAAAVGA